MIELAPSDVHAWAVAATGDTDVETSTWSVERVAYGSASPTTGGLWRVIGSGWSLFVKVVQSFRHWDLFDVLPPEVRAEALATTSWRYEPGMYGSALESIMPTGTRLPHVHAMRDLGDVRVLVVLEDVVTSDTPWDTARFEQAARVLGCLDVRLTRAPWLPSHELHEPGAMLRRFFDSRVQPMFVDVLLDEAPWRHPLLGGPGHRALRADIAELAARMPALLASLTEFTHVRTHGDAAPHNLLVPRDRPDELVVIDWTMGACSPAGEELGQLILGRAHDGVLAPADLVALRDVVVPAYVAGLAAEGLDVAETDLRAAMDTTITLRSAFTALPLERLGEPVTDELADLVDRRLALTRHLVDVGLTLDVVAAA